MWRRSSFRFLWERHVELALVVLWDTDSEGSRERRAAGLGRPRQGSPLGSRSTLRVRVFSSFTKNLAVVAWLDFEGCHSRERALGGEPAGYLQGLT